MMDFVSWDDEIPNIWKVIKFQTTNQILIGTSMGHGMTVNCLVTGIFPYLMAQKALLPQLTTPLLPWPPMAHLGQ